MNAESKKSFIFYNSFLETIDLMPEPERAGCLRALVDCCLGRRELAEVPYPANAIISQMLYNVGFSRQRYEKEIERGARGGRPLLEIDVPKAERLRRELGSWKAAAEAMGISEESLRKARKTYESQKTQKPKNQYENEYANAYEYNTPSGNSCKKPLLADGQEDKQWCSEEYRIGKNRYRDRIIDGVVTAVRLEGRDD